jgi:hypothetical protein
MAGFSAACGPQYRFCRCLLRGCRTFCSSLPAHSLNIAWQWMLQRGEALWQTPWPQLTVPGLMILAQWILAVVLAVGAAKLLEADRK